jgi:hypothetical protein
MFKRDIPYLTNNYNNWISHYNTKDFNTNNKNLGKSTEASKSKFLFSRILKVKAIEEWKGKEKNHLWYKTIVSLSILKTQLFLNLLDFILKLIVKLKTDSQIKE